MNNLKLPMNDSEKYWRITFRFDPLLKKHVERFARKRRWSVNTFVEEAIIEKLAQEK